MTLLLIDTAFDLCQVGLWQDGQLHDCASAPGEARHDVILAPLVEALLQKNNLSIAGLSGIAVTTGPGRFTSLRVGIAFARALILPHPLPLYGIATTAILRAHLERGERGWTRPACVIAVKRGELFVQRDAGTDPVSLPLADAATLLGEPDGVIAIGAGIPDDWQAALPAGQAHDVLSHLPLAAMGACAAEQAGSGLGHAVVRPFYGSSTGAGY